MSEPFLKIDVRGDRELARAIERAGAAFRPEVVHNGLLAGGMLVANDAKAMAPYRTGTLRRSIHLESTEDPLTVKVGTNVPYAAAQEYGASISPKRAKVLHFWIGKPGTGTEVFTKGPVHIPAHPYMRPSIEKNQQRVRDEVRRVILLQLQAAVR